MTSPSEAWMDEGLLALKERKRLLDEVWLLVLFVLFVAVGAPWYLRILEIDFGPVAWSLFGFGTLYVAGTLAAETLASRRSLLLTIALVQAAGIVFLALIWHWTGSLQNPMFLLVFVLPVVAGSLVLVNWHSYATVLFCVAAVATVALIDAPELRWYVSQAGLLPRWIADTLPARTVASQPFPSLNVPPTYSFLLLASFTGLLLAVALTAESITTFLLRLYRRLETSKKALSVAEELSYEVLRASPSPAALVYADTLRVAQASQSFQEHFFLDADTMLNRNFLELVQFAFPDVITGLIASGGEVCPAVYSVQGETKIGKVRVEPIHFGGRSYFYIHIQDVSEQQVLQTAVDVLDNPVIVIGGTKRVVCCNRAAAAIFTGLEPGVQAAAALSRDNLPEGWWDTGLRTHLERRLELHGKRWMASCVSSRIAGEKEPHTVLSLRLTEIEL